MKHFPHKVKDDIVMGLEGKRSFIITSHTHTKYLYFVFFLIWTLALYSIDKAKLYNSQFSCSYN